MWLGQNVRTVATVEEIVAGAVDGLAVAGVAGAADATAVVVGVAGMAAATEEADGIKAIR